MSVQEIVPRPIALELLLDGIQEGTVVLPDFQRDFEWSKEDIVALLSTLMLGWPAGSLLLMRGEPDFFNTREFVDAPSKTVTKYVVLDGQQRLTTLYNALRNVGDDVYALKFDKDLAEGSTPGAEELQDRVLVFDRRIWERDYSIEQQARERLVPLYVLRTAFDFYEWRDDAVAASEDGEALSHMLSRLYRNLLGNLNHYDFPAVVLENSMPAEAVARIFERINKQGRSLKTFDLMVARTYTPDWNLRREWLAAKEGSRNLDYYLEDDGLAIIQTVALAHGRDVRQGATLRLPPTVVHRNWEKAVQSVELALERLQTYGAARREWIPYRSQILTLAGLALTSPNLEESEPRLEKWFWGSSLGGTYDVGSSTRITADLALLERGDLPPTPAAPLDTLIAATRRRSPALWRAFMCLLDRAGAVDPISGEQLAEAEPNSRGVIVSIFPQVRDPQSVSYHLRVFGLVRVTRATARRLRTEPFRKVLEQAATNTSDAWLASQFLPPYEDLLDLRSDEPLDLLELRITKALDYLGNELSGEPIRLARVTAEAEDG